MASPFAAGVQIGLLRSLLEQTTEQLANVTVERDALREALMAIHAFAEERAVCHGYVARIATMANDALHGSSSGGRP